MPNPKLKRDPGIILAFDGDAAGQEAMYKNLFTLLKANWNGPITLCASSDKENGICPAGALLTLEALILRLLREDRLKLPDTRPEDMGGIEYEAYIESLSDEQMDIEIGRILLSADGPAPEPDVQQKCRVVRIEYEHRKDQQDAEEEKKSTYQKYREALK
jgi:hypothetical protein